MTKVSGRRLARAKGSAWAASLRPTLGLALASALALALAPALGAAGAPTTLGAPQGSAAAVGAAALGAAGEAPPTRSFRVAVYIPVGVVEHMGADPAWLESSWETISRNVHVDKVYIETFRSGQTASDALIDKIKAFFAARGVATAGGIAFQGVSRSGQFQSLDYADPKTLAFVRDISARTARHFDEIILDDFFFTNSKSEADIAEKGDRTWTEYRLQKMDAVARDQVVGAAKAANPKVRVTVKFPNWYEHFQGLGYDLAREPEIFDSIYTGTETRDPEITDQQLQQYESYEIFRYFSNIAPGRDLGGWVDTYNVRYLDRYAEQLWDTVFAKAPEMTLFNWANLLDPAPPGERAAWQALPTSFDYFALARSSYAPAATPAEGFRFRQPVMAGAAGYALRQVDPVIGQLGEPIGLASYKPFQSRGEDFLQNYLGMLGIPINLRPTFPAHLGPGQTILLTQEAAADPRLVPKMETALRAGAHVVVTSGLLCALQAEGLPPTSPNSIAQITEMRCTDHDIPVHSYFAGYGAGAASELANAGGADVLFPLIQFYTNETWSIVRGMSYGKGVPLLLMDPYAKGELYVWVMPESFNDLYRLPASVLSAIKRDVDVGMPVRLDGPSQVALFVYDNGTFVVESYLPHPAAITLTGRFARLVNLATGEALTGTAPRPVSPFGFGRSGGGEHTFSLAIQPHSWLAFREETQ